MYMRSTEHILRIGGGVITFTLLYILYKRMEDHSRNEISEYDTIVVSKMLETRELILKEKRPLLWIHIPYTVNARMWESFSSRNTMDINQPYIYACIRSIIDKCGHSFRICIVDDTCFKKLLPSWNMNMCELSEPILGNMRNLAMVKLVHEYGGMVVPFSFICFENMEKLYKHHVGSNNLCFGQIPPDNYLSETNDFAPSLKLFGSVRGNVHLADLMYEMEILYTNNATAEDKFTGTLEKILYNMIYHGKAEYIDGELIGTKTREGKPVTVDMLLSQDMYEFIQPIYGVYIPNENILKRIQYAWFASLNLNDAIEANINVSAMLRKAMGQYLE